MNGLQFDDRLLTPVYSESEGADFRIALLGQRVAGDQLQRADRRRLDQPIMRRVPMKEQYPVPIPDWLRPQRSEVPEPLDTVLVGAM
jgi:hypothetical protein